MPDRTVSAASLDSTAGFGLGQPGAAEGFAGRASPSVGELFFQVASYAQGLDGSIDVTSMLRASIDLGLQQNCAWTPAALFSLAFNLLEAGQYRHAHFFAKQIEDAEASWSLSNKVLIATAQAACGANIEECLRMANDAVALFDRKRPAWRYGNHFRLRSLFCLASLHLRHSDSGAAIDVRHAAASQSFLSHFSCISHAFLTRIPRAIPPRALTCGATCTTERVCLSGADRCLQPDG